MIASLMTLWFVVCVLTVVVVVGGQLRQCKPPAGRWVRGRGMEAPAIVMLMAAMVSAQSIPDACCYLSTPMPDGSTTHSSGTLVATNGEHGIVLTCFHQFRISNTNWRDKRAKYSGTTVTFPATGKTYGAKHVQTDSNNDLVAMMVADPGIEPVSVEYAVQPGQVISAHGLVVKGESVLEHSKTGRVRKIAGVREGTRHPVGEATFGMVQGCSGCGILDGRGRLIGVEHGSGESGAAFTAGPPLRSFLSRLGL